MQLVSADGSRIYYEVHGSGPLLVLLHGIGGDHSVWCDTGWVSVLQESFTVAVVGLRGSGQSDTSEDPAFYSIDNYCRDVDEVVRVNGGHAPFVWGWSLGATIAMHYAKNRHVRAMIACGSYFGRIFSDEFIDSRIARTADRRQLARLEALRRWPIVSPGDLRTSYLVYTGSRDGNVVIQLTKQRDEIEASGGKLVVFDGLDHFGLLSELALIQPTVAAFIRSIV